MDWFWDNFGGVVTTVLAIYGAFLSSLNCWHMWKRDKKELYFDINSNQAYDEGSTNVIINIVNNSLRPVAIKEIGLKYKRSFEDRLSKPVHFDGVSVILPARLETSDQLRYLCNCLYFAGENEQPHNIEAIAVPYAIDTEGQRYKGAPFKHYVSFISCSKSDTDTDNKSEHQQG